MFLLDDVLLAPGKAAFVLFQELARKAQEDWLNDDTIKQDLQQLYEMLEAGRISDKDFEAQECRLLERLEQIARLKFQDKWGTPAPVVGQAEQPIVESSVTFAPLTLPAPTFDHVAPPQPFALPPPAAQPAPSFATPPAALQPPPAPAPMRPIVPMMPIAGRAPVAPPTLMAPPIPVSAPIVPGVPLTMQQVIECAIRALAVLKMRVSSVSSVVPENENWHVTVELVERRGIPDSNDVLGMYELRLDPCGQVLRYERTQMRRRCDFAR